MTRGGLAADRSSAGHASTPQPAQSHRDPGHAAAPHVDAVGHVLGTLARGQARLGTHHLRHGSARGAAGCERGLAGGRRQAAAGGSGGVRRGAAGLGGPRRRLSRSQAAPGCLSTATSRPPPPFTGMRRPAARPSGRRWPQARPACMAEVRATQLAMAGPAVKRVGQEAVGLEDGLPARALGRSRPLGHRRHVLQITPIVLAGAQLPPVSAQVEWTPGGLERRLQAFCTPQGNLTQLHDTAIVCSSGQRETRASLGPSRCRAPLLRAFQRPCTPLAAARSDRRTHATRKAPQAPPAAPESAPPLAPSPPATGHGTRVPAGSTAYAAAEASRTVTFSSSVTAAP